MYREIKKKHSAVKYSFYHQKSQPDKKTKTAGLISVHISADPLAQIALKASINNKNISVFFHKGEHNSKKCVFMPSLA